jgi:hypothetical protein
MSQNVVEPLKPQIIRRRVACWLSKVTRSKARDRARAFTRTHREICNTSCFSSAKVATRTSLNVTLYVHCLSCFTHVYLNHCVPMSMYPEMFTEIWITHNFNPYWNKPTNFSITCAYQYEFRVNRCSYYRVVKAGMHYETNRWVSVAVRYEHAREDTRTLESKLKGAIMMRTDMRSVSIICSASVYCKAIKMLSLYRPRQAPRIPGGWGSQDFLTFSTWWW